ncbi:hypothetical protein [Intestinibacter sp.]|jgi:hypothetical protein|uniref:hypothetical protein n=1 Tax=Intestinibacter sp. TaxID=1965304 RepID=UPI0020654C9F|nr:MAG TPA: hypothetical protein [Caudoviricetes sp.]
MLITIIAWTMLIYSLIGLLVEFFFIFVGDTTKDRVKGFVDVVYFAFTIYFILRFIHG